MLTNAVEFPKTPFSENYDGSFGSQVGGYCCRGRDDHYWSPTGWPEAVTHLRLPQNPACGFPALGSSEVDSQFGDSLQHRVGEVQLWSKQRELRLDLLELLPSDRAVPTPTAQHFAPIVFHGPIHLQQ